MTQSRISIVKIKGEGMEPVRAAVRNSVELLGSPLKGIGPQSKVVIKPNMCADDISWCTGVVTNPSVVRAVCDMVLERNPKEIVIAEAISVGLDGKKGFSFLGYDEIARATGAKLVDLYDEEFVQVPVRDAKLHRTIEVAKDVLDADFLIVVPVMKTHVATGISVCMKCLMGVISAEQKKKFHFFGLAQSIVDLNSVIKPDLFIVDGSIAGQGNGPMANDPVGLGTIMVGFDPRAIDTVAAQVMGFDSREIDVLRLAEESWGPMRRGDIRVTGEAPERMSKTFRRAAGSLSMWEEVECVNGNACAVCAGVLQLALLRAQKMGVLPKLKPLRIVLGPEGTLRNDKGKALIMGKCLSHLADAGNYVPGCPPQVFLVTDELRQMAGLQRLAGRKEDFMYSERDDLRRSPRA